MTDCSTGVPIAKGAIGRTGRHITTVVVRAGSPRAAAGVVLRTLFTTGRLRLAGTAFFTGFFTGLGTTALGTAGAVAALAAGATRLRRRTTGFALAGAATGEHSTSVSIDARSTGRCALRGTVSRLTV